MWRQRRGQRIWSTNCWQRAESHFPPPRHALPPHSSFPSLSFKSLSFQLPSLLSLAPVLHAAISLCCIAF